MASKKGSSVNLTDPDQTSPKTDQVGVGHHHRGDARRDRSMLKKNQERLGVGADHMTPTMKKHRRGTYP